MSDPSDRHATNLELFLDLVFVFAVTQIATMVSHDLTWAGASRGLLISWLVWWQWSQFTWAGSAIDLQQRPATRLLVLCTIPATLTMATAIPAAFDESGAWFGVSYMAVQLLVLGMQGSTALANPDTRQSFFNYASIASIAPLVVVAGGFTHHGARTALWIVAAVINVVGGLRGASSGEWVINPVHFAERHALFVIISLGEALVAIGATAAGIGLTLRTAIGLVSATAVACVLWWTYFAFIPNVAEHTLRQSSGTRRGQLARDLFTFGHFPIVAGIIAYAVVVKHMVAQPYEPLPTADRWLLLISLVIVIGGYLHIQIRVVHRLAPERLAAIAVIPVWLFGGGRLPGAALVGGVAVIGAGMQGITWRRFKAGSMAEVSTNR